jgi:hypothetical protein
MALGETIGFSTVRTQNNRPRGLYPPNNQGAHQVHIALMGDPTLRMHPVIPPRNVTGAWSSTGFNLRWDASSDSDLAGYHIYRASGPSGPFDRISGEQPVRTTSFTDSSFVWPSTFIVRAIKLEQSASGTYFNASQGAFGSTGNTAPPYRPLEIAGGEWRNQVFVLFLNGTSGQGFRIEISENFVNWTSLFTGKFEGSTFEYSDSTTTSSHQRFYRAVAN